MMMLVVVVGVMDECEKPGLPVKDSGFWEKEVIAGFRVWQLAFMSAFACLCLVIVLCCIFRCRIPRTKQEIEADNARKKVTEQFNNHLKKIPVDMMELEKVLPEVITLEHQRVLKGIKEEKMSFFQKLKKTLFAKNEDEDEEEEEYEIDTKTGLSTSEAKTPDHHELEEVLEVPSKEDRSISHQEQLRAAIHKLNKMRQVQQTILALQQERRESARQLAKEASIVQREYSKDKEKDKDESPSKNGKKTERQKTVEGSPTSPPLRERDSSGSGSAILSKHKTFPTFETDVVRDVTLSTFKKAVSEDVEALKQIKEKRGKRMSRQIELTDKDIAVITSAIPKKEPLYEEVVPHRVASPKKSKETKDEAKRDRDRDRHAYPREPSRGRDRDGERDRERHRPHSRGRSRDREARARSRDHEARTRRSRRDDEEGYENGKEDNVTTEDDEERTKF